jgi:histidyl-tRNA synthetase
MKERLQNGNENVKVELDLREGGKLKVKLDSLMNTLGAKHVIVVGVNELNTGEFTVKRDGQEDVTVNESDLKSILF